MDTSPAAVIEGAADSRPAARRPASLMWQLGLLFAMAVLLSSALAATLALSHFKQHMLQSIESQVSAVAQSAANSARSAVRANDIESLGRVLSDLLRVPGIDSITLLDPAGRPLIGAEWSRDLETGARSLAIRKDLPRVAVPSRNESLVDSWWDGSPAASSAWEPLHVNGDRYWANVRADLTEPARALRGALYQVSAWVAVSCALCFALLFLFLRRSLRPLVEIARFAGRMQLQGGEQIQVRASSREVARLAQALNQMAGNLKAQYETIERHDAEMSSVLNTTADGIIGVDESGHVTLTNESTTSLFGWDRTRAIGRPVDCVLPGLDKERIESLLAEAIYTGGRGTRTVRFEFKGSRNGDVLFPVEVALSEISGSGTSRYALFVRDITEKLASEESVRLFRRIVDSSSHGVVISSMTFANEPIVYVNRAFEDLTGYSLGDAIGRRCNFLQGEERHQPGIDQLRRAIGEQREAKVQLRNYRRDGSMFWNELSIAPVFDQEGGLTHYLGIQTDVTARVLAQEAVNRRGEQLDTILSLSPDGFVMFDAERLIAYANAAFCTMTGLPASTLIGKVTFSEFETLMRDRCDPALPYPDVLMDTGLPDTVTLMLPQRRILERVIRTSRSGNGELILCYRDVTRESEIDRMKSDFLSTAAHELRTPMVSIFGFTELMLHRTFPPERSRMMLTTIHRQAGLIVNLVNELLDLARIEARSGKDFNIAITSLRPIVDETLASILMPNDERRVSVDWATGPGGADLEVMVAVDAEKIRQALNNVISNAYKYSPGGGAISLELVTDSAREAMAGIRVRDGGIGMSPEQLARVFERFYRADPSGNIPGTGLGLCLVKEIVELQGGSVEVRSEAGVGTEVTIWLPRRQSLKLAA